MLLPGLAVHHHIIHICCRQLWHAPWRPNGKTLNWCIPKGVLKGVSSLASGAMATCQYPVLRSNMVIYLALPTLCNRSSTLGIGYVSKLEMEFKDLNSILKAPVQLATPLTAGNFSYSQLQHQFNLLVQHWHQPLWYVVAPLLNGSFFHWSEFCVGQETWTLRSPWKVLSLGWV